MLDPAAVLPPCPCDQCWQSKRCGSEHLACQAFALFMEGARPSRWLLQKRTPDALLNAAHPLIRSPTSAKAERTRASGSDRNREAPHETIRTQRTARADRLKHHACAQGTAAAGLSEVEPRGLSVARRRANESVEYCKMISRRTHSTLESRAKDKRPTGGRAYGYRCVEVASGHRGVTVEQAEAAVLLTRLQATEGELERLKVSARVVDVKAIVAAIPGAVARYRELVADFGSNKWVSFAASGETSGVISISDLGAVHNGSPEVVGWFEAALFKLAAPMSVPEPATLSLLALGLVGVGFTRWRKKH